MAHNVEPMDIDNDFDNKENTFHLSNVLPCTEKGYEELDVSELNMKLRYSTTPVSSPMSKSYTANGLDNRISEPADGSLNVLENMNMTRSFNSMMNKTDNMSKSFKMQPLQLHSVDQSLDNNRNASVLRPLDMSHTSEGNKLIATADSNSIENSFPSSPTSVVLTPDVIKEPLRSDGSSPIMRGLKSVLNMFRSSQSPIPSAECDGNITKHDISGPVHTDSPKSCGQIPQAALASTPIASCKSKDQTPSKRNSPHKESVIFNDDLEKELLWKDETTILFSQEKIPIHKLFFQQPSHSSQTKEFETNIVNKDFNDDFNETVQYMDISHNDSAIQDKTITGIQVDSSNNNIAESDGEFVDCETTFANQSDLLVHDENKCNVNFMSGSEINKFSTQDFPIISSVTICKESLDTTISSKSDKFSTSSICNKETLDTTATLECLDNTNINTSQGIDINFDTHSSKGLLDATIISDEAKRPVFGDTFTKEFLDDTEIQHLTEKSLTPATFTQDINDDISQINKTLIFGSDSSLITEKSIPLNIFSKDITQDVETQLNVNEHLNATITVDFVDKSDISTIETKKIENELKENCSQIALDGSLAIDPVETLSTSVTCGNNNTQEVFHQSHVNSINELPVSTIDSDKKIVSQNVGINTTVDISEDQIDNILLSDTTAKDNLQKPLDFDASIASADKSLISATFSKHEDVDGIEDSAEYSNTYSDVSSSCTNQPVDAAIEMNGISVTLCMLDTQCKLEPEILCAQNFDEDVSTKIHDSSKIIPEIKEIDSSIENTENKMDIHTDSNTIDLGQLGVENIDPNLDMLGNQVNSNFKAASIATLDPDIIVVHNDMDENITTDPLEVFDRPADIPLPDGDDIESEVTIESSITDIKSVSKILPDVINVLHASEVEDINKDNEVPIDALIQTKLTADLINDTLLEEEIDAEKTKEIKSVTQNEHGDCIQASIKNILEEKNILRKSNEATSAGKTEATKYLSNDTNEILTKKQSVSEKNELAFSTSLENINDEQEIGVKIEFSAHEKNNPNLLEKCNIDDVNNKVNVVEFVKTRKTVPINVINSVCEMKAEQTILNDTKPQDVVISVEEFKRDELQHYEPSTVQSPEISQSVSLDKIDIDNSLQTREVKNIEENVKDIHTTPTNLHEEILDSENNSPYVLISIDKKADNTLEEDFERIENPFATKSKLSMSPPASPKLVSKGYNFDFDEIEDPFATKPKIRMSPPLESPTILYKSASAKKANSSKPEFHNKNNRKTQSERKKPISIKKPVNVTLGTVSTKLSEMVKHENTELNVNAINELNINCANLKKLSKEDNNCEILDAKLKDNKIFNEVDKSELEINIDNKSKLDINMVGQFEVPERVEDHSPITSSSEQSAYYSAATSSGDSIVTKNVFNLPEIDDINFNPFAKKSKIRLSPSPDVGPLITVSTHRNDQNSSSVTENIGINQTVVNNISNIEEKDSISASNTTCSSKATDGKDITVQEVHTDDEDTIEGPFLEVDEIDNDKISDLDSVNVDVLQFTDLPPQTNEDELFIDAEAFEFLLNQNKSNVVVDSGKESLFLKFDPLFAKRFSSDGVVAALSKIQKRQSTPKKTPKSSQINVETADSLIAGPSSSNVTLGQNTTEENTEDISINTSKPMMVVTPAVNPVVAPRKSMTPTTSNRRSITFTSPAIAVIDRLLSLSANNSLTAYDTTPTQVAREQNEADLALTQLREMLAEKEIHVYNLRSESKELRDRLTTLEIQMKSLETQSEERLKKVNELTAKLSEKTKINKSMASVVEEYERTIASLIAETEQDKKRHDDERMILIKERDEQTAHLASMEVSFSDLHSKYEKSKQLILSCKANEDIYKTSIKDFEENLAKMQNNYELLKQHATSKLNHANQELEKMNRAHEAEVLKLNAMIKRKELHITSLEETLAQKTKANEELTAICDELINKVG